MSVLNERAVLVALKCTHWSGRKLDKRATARFNSEHKADADAGRYNKLLLAKEALSKITKVSGSGRTLHYYLTLPWGDNGQRLLPTQVYWEYVNDMQGLEEEFYRQVDEFVKAYPSLVAETKARLGDLYNPDDYPDPEVIREKFSFSITINPVPDAGDFRVDIENDAMEEIKADLKARLSTTQQEAMRDLWERLRKSVAEVSKKFADTDKKVIFRDTLIGNIRDLVDLIPKMNIDGDPELDRMAAEIKREMADFDPQDLRDFPIERVKAKAKADALVAKMGAFM